MPDRRASPAVSGEGLALRQRLAGHILGRQQRRAIEQVQFQKEQISQLKDEIRVLKGQKKRPVIKPSKLDVQTTTDEPTAPSANKASATVKKKLTTTSSSNQ